MGSPTPILILFWRVAVPAATRAAPASPRAQTRPGTLPNACPAAFSVTDINAGHKPLATVAGRLRACFTPDRVRGGAMDAAMHRNSLLSFWDVHAAVRREPSVRPSRFVRASSRERGRATWMAVRWSSRAWGSAGSGG